MAYIVCDVCGKTAFKTKAGLAGHQKIVHGVDKRKVCLDEVGERLAEINQKIVDTSDFSELAEHLVEIKKKMFDGSEFNEIGERLSVLESEIRVLKEDLSPWIRELKDKYREHIA